MSKYKLVYNTKTENYYLYLNDDLLCDLNIQNTALSEFKRVVNNTNPEGDKDD
jgi:hypothetical protein